MYIYSSDANSESPKVVIVGLNYNGVKFSLNLQANSGQWSGLCFPGGMIGSQ